MAFEGLSSRLQEITRKLRGKARITESDLKEMLREVKLALSRSRRQLQDCKRIHCIPFKKKHWVKMC